MPMPQDYQMAQERFDRFLTEVGEELDLVTRNQCYTSVQAVLLAFRCRLTASQVLLFAGVLPPVLRAIFVADWQDGTVCDFGEPEDWLADVKALRRHHNFCEANAIEGVARALKQVVEPASYQGVLEQLGAEAQRFWAV